MIVFLTYKGYRINFDTISVILNDLPVLPTCLCLPHFIMSMISNFCHGHARVHLHCIYLTAFTGVEESLKSTPDRSDVSAKLKEHNANPTIDCVHANGVAKDSMAQVIQVILR